MCVMGDAGAPWADITQDALGGGGHRGYRAGRSLSAELANTPVIALQARSRTFCPHPHGPACSTLIHTLINRLILAAAALSEPLSAVRASVLKTQRRAVADRVCKSGRIVGTAGRT